MGHSEGNFRSSILRAVRDVATDGDSVIEHFDYGEDAALSDKAD